MLLADALSLTGQVRVLFVAAARGRAPAAEVLAARPDRAAGGPDDITSPMVVVPVTIAALSSYPLGGAAWQMHSRSGC